MVKNNCCLNIDFNILLYLLRFCWSFLMPCLFCNLSCKIMGSNLTKICESFPIFCLLEMCCSTCVISHRARSKFLAFFPDGFFCSRNIRFGVSISMKSIFVSPVFESMIAFAWRAGIFLSVVNNCCYSLSPCLSLASCFIKNCCCNLNIVVLHLQK